MKFSDKLNEFDVLDLLNEYHSELRKLRNKQGFVKKRISELELEYEKILKRKGKKARSVFEEEQSAFFEDSTEVESVQPEVEPEVEDVIEVAVTPKKSPKAKAAPKAKGRKKSTAHLGRKQQPLSQWDQVIVDAVKAKGKAAINSEILEYTTKKAIELGLYEDEKKTRAKINQCLIKLTADNRKALVKVAYAGRGFGYALPKWINKEGELPDEYAI